VSRILLDTCGYSAFKKGHPEVRRRIQEAAEIYLDVVVLGELQAGFMKGDRLEENLAELDEFLASGRVHVVTLDEETAVRYATILRSLQKRGRPIPTNDIWIAASAMRHGLTLVTTDNHFREVAQIVVEVFSAQR
jgi:tRNA(fMet)-specific endonuclease VapC